MDVNMIINLQNVNFYYGQSRALNDISMDFPEKKVTALIGPSGAVNPVAAAVESNE